VRKSNHSKQINHYEEIDNPILLVYEEAHNYIPRLSEAKYKAVKESIERIAKEGRKYGISAMIVSQRPSEISETIFSQCNTFVVMRLTNPTDQSYVKRLLPDSVSSITDNLSGLEQREALVLGTSIPIPTILRVEEVPESRRPKSNDVNFIEKWRRDWDNLDDIDEIINGMIKPLE
jgi:DNA helicase HerA-like ATPase